MPREPRVTEAVPWLEPTGLPRMESATVIGDAAV